MKPPAPAAPSPNGQAGLVAGLYGLLAALWIALSDRLAALVAGDTAQLTLIQNYKGWAFVAITCTLLFFLVRRSLSRLQGSYRALAESEALYESLVQVMPQCLYRMDRESRITFANRALERHLGKPREAILGHSPREVYPADLAAKYRQDDLRVLQGETLNLIEEMVSLDSEQRKRYIEIVKTPTYAPDGSINGIQGIFWDITARKSAEEQIEYLAHHDPLTDLPNRVLLRDRFLQAQGQAARSANRVAILFLDLDHFKLVNDTLGHPIGDRLLQAVAERLRRGVRETDTISRQGGDEFVIVLPELADPESAGSIAGKLMEQMHEPVRVNGHRLNVTFSLGIALYPDDGEDFDTLMKKADTAMYSAKEAGRNTLRFFTAAMNVEAAARLKLQNRLQRALEKEELVLYYQPQFDLASGRILGTEALLRWRDPERGLVPPGEFIPVAEDTGLIGPIGEWVIGEACRELRRWHEAGATDLTMAVNLSPVQFRRSRLVEIAARALQENRLPAECLEFELTESLLIREDAAILETLTALKGLGVKLSIDDFGTGYSSLAYLKRFNVDKLKIDQSFIRELCSNPDDEAIVSAVITMARQLRLRTVAEGVENAEQATMLRRFDCDEVQGFLFGRPMPAADFQALLGHR
ncbi:PAS domain S-box/diguanylate cyclase (GGDEF) domain-containing protein [Azospira oryzae PS]|uniref:PAS domain S-box/diguanylate cyclase (GGDEF) domain-containing protein n=1 Tax=Azospira oryzae (strain ATCC BAA-33 / DSM 13638 / PS) TaxID=640081 RepID=G8QIN3_AZOOP|nr:EAL domain-containing protein [Azospira oryzae]AEV27493.1 PAS domain S-box/diguanylate cyclase (GGDEF) domain-containing protein [Azospira oryzae PS]